MPLTLEEELARLWANVDRATRIRDALREDLEMIAGAPQISKDAWRDEQPAEDDEDV